MPIPDPGACVSAAYRCMSDSASDTNTRTTRHPVPYQTRSLTTSRRAPPACKAAPLSAVSMTDRAFMLLSRAEFVTPPSADFMKLGLPVGYTGTI
ncbi:uncharacterized protein SCHCODRAFT_02639464 [Schizophyllum commune H4-8]|uniref:uncharacterized protein n=1 Tax=Schizophyllum commune (strain H4-8 / FGSC 9210) TaxID=578458 RepID=UPI00215F0E78|nr:uncharacterized protein SCHCODRAFT_02639464 [Schizophyllum commune H4-8]KAI5887998.1 hypothetical protein SCHCODRAFT_02639464 [Schizophyllum commune H4-8]